MGGVLRSETRNILGDSGVIISVAVVLTAISLAVIIHTNSAVLDTGSTNSNHTSSLGNVGSIIVLDGHIIASIDDGRISGLIVPIALSKGEMPVDLGPGRTFILITINDNYTIRVHIQGILHGEDPVRVLRGLAPSSNVSTAIVVFAGNSTGDNLLGRGEKAFIVIRLPAGHELDPSEHIRIEIRPLHGVPLIIERVAPESMPENGSADLG